METRAECLKKFGSDYFIQKKIDAEELFRIDKGIYSEHKYVPEIAVLTYRYHGAVVTMRNAFYMHGLTDVIPEGYDLAAGRDAAKISATCVKQYFVPISFFFAGIERIDYKGQSRIFGNRAYRTNVERSERANWLRIKSPWPLRESRDFWRQSVKE